MRHPAAFRAARRLAPIGAAALLAGALSACSPYGPETATGALVGGASAVPTGSGEGTLARRAGSEGGVVCAYDPLYERDVCYRR